jgi:hypothetical protein
MPRSSCRESEIRRRSRGNGGWLPHLSMKAKFSFSVFESMEAFIPLYDSTPQFGDFPGWGNKVPGFDKANFTS